MDQQEERRKFSRLSVNIKIEYMVVEHVEADFLTTGSKNISSGGICIMAFEKLAPGTFLKLKFSIPGINKFIIATGKLVWVRELSIGYKRTNKVYEWGLEFADINDDDRRRIDEYVKKSKA